jgi:hypothetical protein
MAGRVWQCRVTHIMVARKGKERERENISTLVGLLGFLLFFLKNKVLPPLSMGL